ASLEEANAAVRATMDTTTMGTRFLRWMVVEHEGRFYGAIAKAQDKNAQPNPLGADTGSVVAWNSLDHVSDGPSAGWQAYTWTKTGGSETKPVPYGEQPFPGGGVGAGSSAPTGTPGAAGSSPAGSSPAGSSPAASSPANAS